LIKLLVREFESEFSKLNRTGLELRKSLPINALRFLGKRSFVTKRVESGDMVQFGETAVRNYCDIYSALLAVKALLLHELKRSHA